MLCKDCICYQPISENNETCGECCIGDKKFPIAKNADITGCCLFEPKQTNVQNYDISVLKMLDYIRNNCHEVINADFRTESVVIDGMTKKQLLQLLDSLYTNTTIII